MFTTGAVSVGKGFLGEKKGEREEGAGAREEEEEEEEEGGGGKEGKESTILDNCE